LRDDWLGRGMTFASTPRMTQARQALGELGEELACRELERRGHAIITRRYRTKWGELDVVTNHQGVTVFVEVRARSDGSFGDPAESVTMQKQQRVIWMAQDYVTRNRLDEAPCRFDVVSIETEFTPPRVTVFEDAFRPGW
jgi:putative endonuclease